MQITRFNTAQPYDARNHFGMTAMRLQGGEISDCEDFWVGFSTFLPGGGAEWGSVPIGKVYIVIDGEITIKTETEEIILATLDSVFIEPDEKRSILNASNHVATMLVVSA